MDFGGILALPVSLGFVVAAPFIYLFRLRWVFITVCGLSLVGLPWWLRRQKHLPTMRETWVWSLDQEDSLEKEMATHSGTLAWKIPWMEELGGLQSMGSQRVGHYWATSLSLFLWLVSHCRGFSGCRTQAPGHRGLVAPWRMESSRIRDRTQVPCIGRWVLNHWTTREVLCLLWLNFSD